MMELFWLAKRLGAEACTDACRDAIGMVADTQMPIALPHREGFKATSHNTPNVLHTANLSMRLVNEILHQPCNVHCNGRYDSKPFHAATASFKVHFCFNWVKYKQPFARFAVSKSSRSKLVETTQDDCGLGRANVCPFPGLPRPNLLTPVGSF